MHFVRIMNVCIGHGCQKLKVGMGKYPLRDVRETAYEIYYAVSLVLCADLCGLGAIACDEYSYGEDYSYGCHHINFRLQFFKALTYKISTGKKKSLENCHARVDVVNVTRSPQYTSGVIRERHSVSAAN